MKNGKRLKLLAQNVSNILNISELSFERISMCLFSLLLLFCFFVCFLSLFFNWFLFCLVFIYLLSIVTANFVSKCSHNIFVLSTTKMLSWERCFVSQWQRWLENMVWLWTILRYGYGSPLWPVLVDNLFMEGLKLMALITAQRTSKIWDRFVQNPKAG